MVEGEIDICVRDPVSGALFNLEQGDLLGAAFREEIIRGGIVRAVRLRKYRAIPRLVALTKVAFLGDWLAEEKSRRPAADERNAGPGSWRPCSPVLRRKSERSANGGIEAKRLFGV